MLFDGENRLCKKINGRQVNKKDGVEDALVECEMCWLVWWKMLCGNLIWNLFNEMISVCTVNIVII